MNKRPKLIGEDNLEIMSIVDGKEVTQIYTFDEVEEFIKKAKSGDAQYLVDPERGDVGLKHLQER